MVFGGRIGSFCFFTNGVGLAGKYVFAGVDGFLVVVVVGLDVVVVVGLGVVVQGWGGGPGGCLHEQEHSHCGGGQVFPASAIYFNAG